MPAPQFQPPEVSNIMNVVNTWLQWKSINGPARGYSVFHPSAFGGCLRRMQYQKYAEMGFISVEEEIKDPKTIRIFDTGHSLHERWATYFEHIGVLRGVWECANECCGLWDNDGRYIGNKESCAFLQNDVPGVGKMLIPSPRVYGKENKIGVFKPEKCSCGSKNFTYHEITVEDKQLNFRGHCDQILDFSNFDPNRFKQGNPVDVLFRAEDLPKKPIVLDMKSINSFSFKNKLEHGPSLVYKTQLVIYCNILDLDYGVLVYENKDDASTKIYKVDRDVNWWNHIKRQASDMNEMVSDKLLPPPRPSSQNSSDCKYCEFQSICHKSKIWDDPALSDKRLKFYGLLE